MELMRQLQRVLQPLNRRLSLMVSRATVLRSDSSTKIQTLQLQRSETEIFDEVEHFEAYGFTAKPFEGAEALLLARGGWLGHLIAVATPDRRHRLKNLKNGEVAIYDDLGNKIILRRDKIEVTAVTHVEVNAPTCTINAATTTINGNVVLNGNLSASGSIAAEGQISSPAGVSTGSVELGSHTHSAGTNSNGNTGAPN